MNIIKRNLKHTSKRIRQVISRPRADNSFTEKVESLTKLHSLPVAIVSAITIALLLTVISVLLYSISGAAKLDLSRPGYESARGQIHRSNGSDQNFSASGSLDGKVIKDFLKIYDKQAKDLRQYSVFKEDILNDAQLGLSGEQTAPNDGANLQP